ncbi:MAG: sigma 54-interacting transcriptional regulator [Nevskiales bacterium]
MSEPCGKLLLVDDDPDLRRLLSIRLRASGHAVETADGAAQALNVIPSFQPDLVITDLRMEQMDGMQLLRELQRLRPGLPVLIITAHGTIPDAVQATQHGAFDFLTKPVDKDLLLRRVGDALRLSGAAMPDDDWHADIVTGSQVMLELLADARLVAGSDVSVIITGDSGTGKELLARAIHKASPRRGHEFVAINCGAMPENLLESELFGHEKGAFTGATRDHAGLFRAAAGGTVFLDEIGDMPLPLQVKLLRVLQERAIRPIGSTRTIPVDVRVISATHRDLLNTMAEGRFREDLYYRLKVVSLALPPLARRTGDIPLLVAHFLKFLAARQDGQRKVYSPEAMEMLVMAEWPGNVRQLYNMVEQNVALSPTPVISAALVEKALGGGGKLPSFAQARDEFTRNYLIQLLQITGANVSQAAKLAERNRTEFYKLLARHHVSPADFKQKH